MEINSLTPKEHFFKANEHYKNREYSDAEREYRNAIEKYPSFSEAHYNLANLLLELNRKKEAEDEYRRALKIDIDFVEANYNLGILLFIERKYKESQNLFSKAIKIKPHDVLIRKYLEKVSSLVEKKAPPPVSGTKKILGIIFGSLAIIIGVASLIYGIVNYWDYGWLVITGVFILFYSIYSFIRTKCFSQYPDLLSKIATGFTMATGGFISIFFGIYIICGLIFIVVVILALAGFIFKDRKTIEIIKKQYTYIYLIICSHL